MDLTVFYSGFKSNMIKDKAKEKKAIAITYINDDGNFCYPS